VQKVAPPDDDDEEVVVAKRIRSAHEVEVIEAPDPPALGAQVVIRPAGDVQSVVGSVVVVKALAGSVALNIGTVMCFESREVVGIVEEVLGPTAGPYYSIRKVKGFAGGERLVRNAVVFFVVNTATYAIPAQLWTKGCDASDVFDEELPEHQLEFSDDEEEKKAKTKKRKKREPLANLPGPANPPGPAISPAPVPVMTPEMYAFQMQQWQIYMWQQQQLQQHK
jgi:H/ACA ribonucleoprotein complex non-core subunit NAF1